MSEKAATPDLVERSRLAFTAASRRDLDTLMTFYASDAVLDLSDLGLGTFEGHPAIRGFLEDWHANYEELEIAPEEILDLGNGVIFSVIAQKGRPVGSSGDVQQRQAIVLVWVAGLFVRITHYGDIDEARAAAERLAEERAQSGV